MTCKEKPSKSILKSEQEKATTLGTYNIYTKRASFKDDVILQQFIQDKCEPATPCVIEAKLPIAPDVTEEELTPEEISRRKEFKQKRHLVDLEGADGLNLKAVLAHRVPLPGVEGDDEAEVEAEKNVEEEEENHDEIKVTDQQFHQTIEQIPSRSIYPTNNDDSFSLLSKSSKHQSDIEWNFSNMEHETIIDTLSNRRSDQLDSCCETTNISYSVPNIVNTLSTSTDTIPNDNNKNQ
ncbi:unnamed protein product [Schistosoma rodhaini]|uniref:Uncharacterized protein n=1 Tax=Schistosoma mansoni TaxID=6183 RepID=A0A5K4FB47_SCHMA|nr:unnamed protein product [Schistosoma rodhaini]